MITYNAQKDCFEGSDDIDDIDDDETNNGDTIQTIEDLIDNSEVDPGRRAYRRRFLRRVYWTLT
jgi:hypothetical protein